LQINKTFIKSQRTKIKRIKTEIKIPKTKRTCVYFLGHEREKKGWKETITGKNLSIIHICMPHQEEKNMMLLPTTR
jgi:hypothetical protein